MEDETNCLVISSAYANAGFALSVKTATQCPTSSTTSTTSTTSSTTSTTTLSSTTPSTTSTTTLSSTTPSTTSTTTEDTSSTTEDSASGGNECRDFTKTCQVRGDCCSCQGLVANPSKPNGGTCLGTPKNQNNEFKCEASKNPNDNNKYCVPNLHHRYYKLKRICTKDSQCPHSSQAGCNTCIQTGACGNQIRNWRSSGSCRERCYCDFHNRQAYLDALGLDERK